jgi:hypothetical protein
MDTAYRHTQVSVGTLTVLGAALAVSLWFSLDLRHTVLIAVTVMVACLLLLFSTLTVVVGDQAVKLFFGPGLIRRRIPLRRIRDVRTVRTPWYYGWGIRLTPSGWLWRVAGQRGIELAFDDGHRFRIGSDEPDRLAEVLRRQIVDRR